MNKYLKYFMPYETYYFVYKKGLIFKKTKKTAAVATPLRHFYFQNVRKVGLGHFGWMHEVHF